MKFEKQDNWKDFKHLLEGNVIFALADKGSNIVYASNKEGQNWKIRMNDFPAEPLYTLIVDGNEIIHFNDWPENWSKPK